MDARFLADWLNLLLRWAHLIAGIGWIGTSFYFVALDFSLKKRAGLPAGVAGTAWEVHGGGFYHVREISRGAGGAAGRSHLVQVGSLSHLGHRLPAADRSVSTGTPTTYLIDPAVLPLRPGRRRRHLAGRACSAGWFVYDALCRSAARSTSRCCLAAAVFVLIVAAPMASRMSSPAAARSSMSAPSSARSWPPMCSRSSFPISGRSPQALLKGRGARSRASASPASSARCTTPI